MKKRLGNKDEMKPNTVHVRFTGEELCAIDRRIVETEHELEKNGFVIGGVTRANVVRSVIKLAIKKQGW